jgi:hypothetical protein
LATSDPLKDAANAAAQLLSDTVSRCKHRCANPIALLPFPSGMVAFHLFSFPLGVGGWNLRRAPQIKTITVARSIKEKPGEKTSSRMITNNSWIEASQDIMGAFRILQTRQEPASSDQRI